MEAKYSSFAESTGLYMTTGYLYVRFKSLQNGAYAANRAAYSESVAASEESCRNTADLRSKGLWQRCGWPCS